MQQLNTATRFKAIGPYSQAVRTGNLLFCSGVIGVNSQGSLAEGLEAQLHETFENIKAILAQEHLSIEHVVKTTCFLADMKDFVKFNERYAAVFGDHKPARSTVQVAKLPKDALVEIEVIAEISQ